MNRPVGTLIFFPVAATDTVTACTMVCMFVRRIEAAGGERGWLGRTESVRAINMRERPGAVSVDKERKRVHVSPGRYSRESMNVDWDGHPGAPPGRDQQTRRMTTVEVISARRLD